MPTSFPGFLVRSALNLLPETIADFYNWETRKNPLFMSIAFGVANTLLLGVTKRMPVRENKIGGNAGQER